MGGQRFRTQVSSPAEQDEARLTHNSAGIVLRPRPNCASATRGLSGRNNRLPAAAIGAFTTIAIRVCNYSTAVKNGFPVVVNQIRPAAFTGVGRCGTRLLCSATRKRLGDDRTASYTRRTARGHAADRKGASDGTHSHSDRHHGDNVVWLSCGRHPRDDLGPRGLFFHNLRFWRWDARIRSFRRS